MTTQKALKFILAAIAITLLALIASTLTSCTLYHDSEKGQTYVSTANRGFTTNKLGDNTSQTSGITSALGGAFDTTDTSSAFESTRPAYLNIGGEDGMTVVGIVDQSTWADTVGNWTWRVGRAIVTGKVLGSAIDWFKADDLAKTQAGTDQLAITEGTDRLADGNRTKEALAEIDSRTAIELAEPEMILLPQE